MNYTIVSLIGKGGMGSVYLAEHKYIKQQKVAIKVINGNMTNDFTRKKLTDNRYTYRSTYPFRHRNPQYRRPVFRCW